jgi:hypothetical protein
VTGIEIAAVNPADIVAGLVVMGLVLGLTGLFAGRWVWRATEPPAADEVQPEPGALDVVEAAMVRSRRRRHHVPAHPVYAPGRARVHEGPTFDLTEARRAARR